MDYGWSGGRFGKRNIDNNDHLFWIKGTVWF
jgi:hypothetical protein